MIPTGGVVAVEGTDFDFRVSRPIRREIDGEQLRYDHNWCLALSSQPCRRVARLRGARSGLAMEVWTTEPGIQFYAGHKVARDVPGWETAGMARSRASASNRRIGRIRRTIPIFRRRCCGPAKPTARRPNTASATPHDGQRSALPLRRHRVRRESLAAGNDGLMGKHDARCAAWLHPPSADCDRRAGPGIGR